MTSEFESDKASIQRALDKSREELLVVLRSLKDGDIEKVRRGGWSVGRILEHVIQSEVLYTRVITHLRGLGPSEEPLPAAPTTAEGALRDENAARSALVEAFEGVEEETFYAIGKVGHDEYSVLSVLENQSHHEQEHAAQIKEILAAG